MRKKFKFLCIAVALAFGGVQTLQAEDANKDYKPYSHYFFGIHGGAQATLSDYNFGELITPVYGVSFGNYFTPVVGTRLHVSGYQNRGGIDAIDQTYDYKYVTSDIDLLLNLTNLFSKTDDHIFNVILFGGIGLNYAWDNDDMMAINQSGKASFPQAWNDDLLSHNARVGVQFDLNLAKHFGLNLELAANSLSDNYNSQIKARDDWQFTASLGLIFKFGHKQSQKAPAYVEPVAQTPIEVKKDTVWYDEVTYKDTPAQKKMESQIYYEISKTEPQKSKIDEIVAFVKKHKDCKISIVSYADKGTGNPTINMQYSKERTQNVVDALVKAGIDKSIITADAKGDTVQPFKENDKNRVTITVITGEGTEKEKVVTKNFRVE